MNSEDKLGEMMHEAFLEQKAAEVVSDIEKEGLTFVSGRMLMAIEEAKTIEEKHGLLSYFLRLIFISGRKDLALNDMEGQL